MPQVYGLVSKKWSSTYGDLHSAARFKFCFVLFFKQGHVLVFSYITHPLHLGNSTTQVKKWIIRQCYLSITASWSSKQPTPSPIKTTDFLSSTELVNVNGSRSGKPDKVNSISPGWEGTQLSWVLWFPQILTVMLFLLLGLTEAGGIRLEYQWCRIHYGTGLLWVGRGISRTRRQKK